MPNEGLNYRFEVDGKLHATRDAILDGRQIRIAANRTPPSGFRLVEAKHDVTRAVGLEDRVHLDPDKVGVFRTFPGDRTYSFTVDEREWAWGADSINEDEIRLYGGIDDDRDLILDGETDVVVGRGEPIRLGGKEVEAIRSRLSTKTITVIVNGREKEVPRGPISFETLVSLAFPLPPAGPNVSFTVTYRKGPDSHPEGSLTQGQSVRAKHGEVFNVRATDKS